MFRKSLPVMALTLILAGACSSGSRSQEPQSRSAEARLERGGRGERGAWLLRGIQLTGEQQQRIDSVRVRYRNEMRALRDRESDRQQSRAKMRDLMERQNAEIRAILTPDQQRVFDQNLERMRARMRHRDGRFGNR
jgi:periplasmic protein CpxP/Spy